MPLGGHGAEPRSEPIRPRMTSKESDPNPSLLAAALLVTPGVLTDAFGFLCLVPGFRTLVKDALMRRFEKAVSENRVHIHVSGAGTGSGFEPAAGHPEREIIDVTPQSGSDGSRPSRGSGS